LQKDICQQKRYQRLAFFVKVRLVSLSAVKKKYQKEDPCQRGQKKHFLN